MQYPLFLTNFQKYIKYQISWRPIQCEPKYSMRTDGWKDRRDEANGHLSQFCKHAWKIVNIQGVSRKNSHTSYFSKHLKREITDIPIVLSHNYDFKHCRRSLLYHTKVSVFPGDYITIYDIHTINNIIHMHNTKHFYIHIWRLRDSRLLHTEVV